MFNLFFSYTGLVYNEKRNRKDDIYTYADRCHAYAYDNTKGKFVRQYTYLLF